MLHKISEHSGPKYDILTTHWMLKYLLIPLHLLRTYVPPLLKCILLQFNQLHSGCVGKIVRSLENVCHTWAHYRCDHDKVLYKSTFTLPYLTFYGTVQFQTTHPSNQSHTISAWQSVISHPSSTVWLPCNQIKVSKQVTFVDGNITAETSAKWC